MVIYIAGAIRGKPDYMEHFCSMEKRILDENQNRRIKHEVINPARHKYPVSLAAGRGKEDAIMKVCKGYLDMADAILLLDGWEDSKGARAELKYFLDQNDGFAEIYTESGSGEKYRDLFGK